MPGTGIHGYTGPSLYGGSYNISNGIIQSGSGASSSGTASRNSPYGTNNYELNKITSKGTLGNNIATSVAGLVGMDDSDYGEYIRQALDVSANNTATSQAFAREQMEYQRQSDATAMAWSALEAQKNRDWQERLANTAHQREVADLIEAGLNPILSANQGAYTGSGATGQAFSSSGAMGSVDTTANGIIGQLISTVMNTASQAAIAGMYTDATRYQADMSYAINKMTTESQMLMQDKSISSNEKIGKLNSDTAIANAGTAAAASMASSGMMAGAQVQSSENALKSGVIQALINQETQNQKNINEASIAKANRENQRQIAQLETDVRRALSPYYTTKTEAKNLLDNVIGAVKGIFGENKSHGRRKF